MGPCDYSDAGAEGASENTMSVHLRDILHRYRNGSNDAPFADASSSSSRDREPKRPVLHPLLSPETNALWDARLAPAPTPSAASAQSVIETATAGGARRLRIVSREFPWTIEVENHRQNAVTCADVFSALYTGLSAPITPSEWTLADETKKESVKRANRNRGGRRLRRIDWLGSRVHFKGLSRDDALGRTRLLPEDDFWPDTWAVKFGSRS